MKLPPDAIHVWLAFEDELPADPQEFAALLSAAELERANKLHVAADRRRFFYSRALQRTVLSLYASEVPPQDWRFVAGAHGKPLLAPEFAALELHFNLAHTEGVVALALSREPVLGIDVESIRNAAPLPVASRYFTFDEVRDLSVLPADRQSRRFYALWTLKEAWLKASGLGLAAGLGNISFAFGPGDHAWPARVANDDPGHWNFWQAEPSAGHLLALAVRRVAPGPDVQVEMRRCVPGVPVGHMPMPAPL